MSRTKNRRMSSATAAGAKESQNTPRTPINGSVTNAKSGPRTAPTWSSDLWRPKPFPASDFLIESLMSASRGEVRVPFEQILRAAPGYQLHRAAAKLIPDSFRTVHIRPRYTHTSYRDHDGVMQRQLNVVYENFVELPKNRDIVLIMQDTVASSKSAEVSIEAAMRHCEEVGSRIRKWILYGFISLEGAKLLDKVAQSYGIPLVVFAMGNLTALCANNYDMPLYGVDEWLWRKNHTVHKLGALVDRTTFVEYVKELVPGSDQPGDWSARQSKLFTGSGYEDGNIQGHLENSTRLINSLLEIGTFSEWQKQLAHNELRLLNEELAKSRSSIS